MPVLAKGKTRTGRLWTYVRDDRPFGGRDRPAAVFFYSPDRSGKHPEQPSGKLHRVDAGGRPRGVRPALSPGSQAGPIIEAACWAHARRYFFEVARLDKTPIAIEAVKRIDALFAIEREINGIAQQERLRVRSEQSRPLVLALDIWLREQRAKLSGQSKVAKAIAYSLTHALLRRWPAVHVHGRAACELHCLGSCQPLRSAPDGKSISDDFLEEVAKRIDGLSIVHRAGEEAISYLVAIRPDQTRAINGRADGGCEKL